MDYREQYQRYVAMVEETIEQVLPQTEEECPNEMRIPKRLCEAMRYSLLAGGKRIRPVLLLATCEMLGGDIRQARVPAAALEMIHTYSLIHDDLPGMDNDDYRRGRLTNHKVFGEGFAILAGDGLLNYAYECILNNALAWGENTPGHIRAAQEIARRAGVSGMVAGQSIDLLSEHREPNEATLQYKMTWPSLVGVEAAQKKSRELWTRAEEALSVFGDSAWFLRAFAEALAKRKK